MKAIEIIQRSIVMHPSLFIEGLENRRNADLNYLADKTGAIRRPIQASADATARAITYVKEDSADRFAADMAAGIIALNVACRFQCLPAHVRTAAAVAQWESEE